MKKTIQEVFDLIGVFNIGSILANVIYKNELCTIIEHVPFHGEVDQFKLESHYKGSIRLVFGNEIVHHVGLVKTDEDVAIYTLMKEIDRISKTIEEEDEHDQRSL